MEAPQAYPFELGHVYGWVRGLDLGDAVHMARDLRSLERALEGHGCAREHVLLQLAVVVPVRVG